MRNNRVLARAMSSVAGSVLLLTVAACGGDGNDVAEDAPAGDAPSASVEADEDEAGAGYDETELLDAMKAAIADSESAHVTMELNGGGQQMTGEGDVSYAGESTSMRMVMQVPQMGDREMEMRMVGDMVYMSIPPMTPKGKFIEFDTNDPNSPLGGLGGVTQGDPLATFDAFDAGLQDAEYVGAEDVDGEELDHYVLTVDAEKAAKAQGQTHQQGMPETITYDMWIDDEDLMRRIEFDLGAMTGAAEGSGGMVMTMSDWGKPVSVKAPPASALVEMPNQPPA